MDVRIKSGKVTERQYKLRNVSPFINRAKSLVYKQRGVRSTPESVSFVEKDLF